MPRLNAAKRAASANIVSEETISAGIMSAKLNADASARRAFRERLNEAIAAALERGDLATVAELQREADTVPNGDHVAKALWLHGLSPSAKLLAPLSAPAFRLKIDGQIVLFDGQVVPLQFTGEKKENALAFLRELLAIPGDWKSGPEIGRATNIVGVRFDRVYRDLPPKIKAQIESSRMKGYRLKLA